MKPLLLSLGILLVFCGSNIHAQDPNPVGQRIGPFSLQDYRGKVWTNADFPKENLLVVAFLGTECPLAKLYAPRLVELEKTYRQKNVSFVGINSNVHDSVTEIAAYARKHNLEFPILKDVGNQWLTNSMLHAPHKCLFSITTASFAIAAESMTNTGSVISVMQHGKPNCEMPSTNYWRAKR